MPTPNDHAILELNGVHTYYGNIHALKGVSLAIPEGDIACLIGANGAGKSTTLMTIFGVQQAKKGEIIFKGEPIHQLRPEQVASRGVAQTPEGRQIFPRMSVMENLDMGAYLRRDKDGVKEDLEWVLGIPCGKKWVNWPEQGFSRQGRFPAFPRIRIGPSSGSQF